MYLKAGLASNAADVWKRLIGAQCSFGFVMLTAHVYVRPSTGLNTVSAVGVPAGATTTSKPFSTRFANCAVSVYCATESVRTGWTKSGNGLNGLAETAKISLSVDGKSSGRNAACCDLRLVTRS